MQLRYIYVTIWFQYLKKMVIGCQNREFTTFFELYASCQKYQAHSHRHTHTHTHTQFVKRLMQNMFHQVYSFAFANIVYQIRTISEL